MTPGFQGAIYHEDQRDWTLAGNGITNLPVIKHNILYEYNQLEFRKEFGDNLCTLYAPIGVVSVATATVYTKEERKELCNIRSEMSDFNPSIGGYLNEGVNCVRKYHNKKYPNDTVSQYAIQVGSDEFFDALQKNHRINIGYHGNSTYNNDISLDGVLDSSEIGKPTYGHSTTVRRLKNTHGSDIYVIDNYFKVKKYNKYKFKDFKAFLSLCFPTAYLLLKD